MCRKAVNQSCRNWFFRLGNVLSFCSCTQVQYRLHHHKTSVVHFEAWPLASKRNGFPKTSFQHLNFLLCLLSPSNIWLNKCIKKSRVQTHLQSFVKTFRTSTTRHWNTKNSKLIRKLCSPIAFWLFWDSSTEFEQLISMFGKLPERHCFLIANVFRKLTSISLTCLPKT